MPVVEAILKSHGNVAPVGAKMLSSPALKSPPAGDDVPISSCALDAMSSTFNTLVPAALVMVKALATLVTVCMMRPPKPVIRLEMSTSNSPKLLTGTVEVPTLNCPKNVLVAIVEVALYSVAAGVEVPIKDVPLNATIRGVTKEVASVPPFATGRAVPL